MAYTIRYVPVKQKQKRKRFLWTCFFFLLFLLVTNLFCSEQLAILQEIIFPQSAQTFWQDVLNGMVTDAN